MKVAHLADIQLRALKRHEEFKAHFDNLYTSLIKEEPDVIVICGDIVHQKLVISPELVLILSEFFKRLSAIAPLCIIAGNHDALIGQKSRLDVLTPIINNLENYSIKYFKDSGVYSYDEDHDFVVFSCLDDEEKWPEKTNKHKISIGLYHGMVDGCVLDNGFIMENTGYGLDYFFERVDYLLMGDIHKRQSFADGKAQFAGSLIQQNYAETTDKGYLLWSIRNKDDFDVKFVGLPNICPFYTVKLDDELDFKQIPEEEIQKNARIRIISRELNIAEKKDIKNKLQLLWDPIEIKFDDKSVVSPRDIIISDTETKADSLESIEIQNKLIENHLKEYSLPQNTLEMVYGLNKKYDKEVKANDDILRNTSITLDEIRFSNMMSFGEDNRFNFNENKGLVGILGNNGSGKSSLLIDIPLYCLTNKISKKGVVKNDLLINDTKDTCSATIHAQIDKDRLEIHRNTYTYLKSGKKKGKPVYQGKTDVDFKIRRGEEVIDMNGSERSDTDKNIRSFVGDMETLTLTSIAPQWQLLGLIDAGGTDRLKIISSYFGIDVFDKKHSLAKEDQRDVKALIKSVENVDFEKEIAEHEEKIKELNKELEANTKNRDSIKAVVDNLKESLLRHEIQAENTDLSKKRVEMASILREFRSRNGVYSNQKKGILAKIMRLNGYDCLKNAGCSLFLEQKSHKEDLEKCEKSIKETEERISLAENKLKDLDDRIETERNKNKNEKQAEIKREIKKSEGSLRLCETTISRNTKEIARIEEKINHIDKQRQIFYDNKEKFDAYNYYLKCMAKDGIVKKIVADNVGIINKELDKILSETVSFRAEIVAEEKGKELEIYYIPARGEKRRVELCSGMEKSMVAIALRVALTKITTLPKLNILVLDEPLNALDDEYLYAFGQMLEYMKEHFDAVYIISHNDAIKGFCDITYTVDRDEKGYAKIY